jgi:hypothetical protein
MGSPRNEPGQYGSCVLAKAQTNVGCPPCSLTEALP